MKGASAVIFDLDGMIVASDRVSDRLVRDRGIPMSVFADFFTGPFQRCLIGAADLKEELLPVIDAWGWKGSVEELIAYWFLPEHNRIDERFKEVIDSLRTRGINCHLATNNEKYRAENMLQERGLAQWFDGVFLASEIGSKKPEAAFYEYIVNALHVSEDKIMYWDDEQAHIDVANNLGLDAHLYKDFEEFSAMMHQL